MSKLLLKNIAFLALLSSSVLPVVGQQLFIVGSANNPSQPELYVQDGADGFIYVQGGVKATGTSSPNITINGGLFVADDGNTPGNIENGLTGADLRFDKAVGGTSVTFSGVAPTADASRIGTVHLMSAGTQQIISPSGQKVHFFNLNLNDNNAGNALREVIASSGAQTYVTVGTTSASPVSSTGRLLLGNEHFELDNNVVEVRNTSVQAIERDDAGTPTAADFGLDPDNQEDNTSFGLVAANTTGRLGRMSDGANSYLFPIAESGTRTFYRPALIMGGTAGMYYVTLQPFNAFNTDINTAVPAAQQPYITDPNFVWRMNGPANSTPQFRLYDSQTNIDMAATGCDIDSLITNLGVAQSEAANYQDWTYEGGGATGQTICASCLLFGTSNTQTTNGLSGMEAYALGSPVAREGFTLAQKPQAISTTVLACNPFPISMVNLKAIPKFNTYIELTWTTNVEINSDRFEVERSTNGTNFAHIPSMNVTANHFPSDYSKNDLNVQPNVRYYYRVKMLDIDGTYKYSNIVDAMLSGGQTTLGSVYPNPTNKEINISIYSVGNNDFNFVIYNAIGQAVWKKDVQAVSGENVFTCDLADLAYGTYELVVKDGDGALKGAVKLVKY